jgi:hypothetical protein
MIRDLRKYARQTSVQLFVGFLILLFIVGDGLIYLIYGQSAAIMGLTCVLAGLLPVIVIALIFFLLGWIVERADRK